MVLSFKTQPFLQLSKMPHGKADAHHVVLNYKKDMHNELTVIAYQATIEVI